MSEHDQHRKQLESRFALNIPIQKHQQRKRGFAPKVRTGCVSCKQARVRCSEGKPVCKRCTKRKIDCCYQLPVAWVFVASEGATNKEPKQVDPEDVRGQYQMKDAATQSSFDDYPYMRCQAAHAADDSLRPGSHLSPLRRRSQDSRHATPPSIEVVPFYTNPQHAAALHYFLAVPAPRVAYNKACDFFTITLPQVTWLHPAVMESMVALATISASRRGSSTATWTTSSPLYHHSKAINTLISSKPARHITLLVCMVLWLYEQFDNSHERALLHRENAAKLLEEWRHRDFGTDRLMDDFICDVVEPAFEMGFKITAPVKLTREVLGALRVLVDTPIDKCKPCTFAEAEKSLRACIDLLVAQGDEDSPAGRTFAIRPAFLGLCRWNYLFENSENSSARRWTVDGPTILSYATTVALLAQKKYLAQHKEDEDWKRAIEFLLEESSRLHQDSRKESTHRSLLQGVAVIASWQERTKCHESQGGYQSIPEHTLSIG